MVILPSNMLAKHLSHYTVVHLSRGDSTYLTATSTPILVFFKKGRTAITEADGEVSMLPTEDRGNQNNILSWKKRHMIGCYLECPWQFIVAGQEPHIA